MKKSCPHFRNLLFVLFVFTTILKSNAQTPDQSQMVYSGGLSARSLNGYSVWQSFTAGITGALTEIRLGFFGNINGQGTMKVLAGYGTGGTELYRRSGAVVCNGGNSMIGFSLSVNIISGNVYTFEFIPGAGMPDPYGVQVQIPGTYAGGQMGMKDPFGSYPLPFDMVFQTFVSNPLANEILSFEATNRMGIASLVWTVDNSQVQNLFEIEKSADGRQFNKVGSVHANLYSGNAFTYSDRIDKDVKECYYRLKLIHSDGPYQYSNIKKLYVGENSIAIASFSRNKYRITNKEKQNCQFAILNPSGAMIKKMHIPASEHEIIIDLGGYPSGVYIFIVENGIQKTTSMILNE